LGDESSSPEKSESEHKRDEKWTEDRLRQLHQALEKAGSQKEASEVARVIEYVQERNRSKGGMIEQVLLWDESQTALKPTTRRSIVDALAYRDKMSYSEDMAGRYGTTLSGISIFRSSAGRAYLE